MTTAFLSSVRMEENVLMGSMSTLVTVLQDTQEIIARLTKVADQHTNLTYCSIYTVDDKPNPQCKSLF